MKTSKLYFLSSLGIFLEEFKPCAYRNLPLDMLIVCAHDASYTENEIIPLSVALHANNHQERYVGFSIFGVHPHWHGKEIHSVLSLLTRVCIRDWRTRKEWKKSTIKDFLHVYVAAFWILITHPQTWHVSE